MNHLKFRIIRCTIGLIIAISLYLWLGANYALGYAIIWALLGEAGIHSLYSQLVKEAIQFSVDQERT